MRRVNDSNPRLGRIEGNIGGVAKVSTRAPLVLSNRRTPGVVSSESRTLGPSIAIPSKSRVVSNESPATIAALEIEPFGLICTESLTSLFELSITAQYWSPPILAIPLSPVTVNDWPC